MLVLTRKRHEGIVIGEGENQINLVVVEIRGDRVRIGIDAPKQVNVDRLEVHMAKERDKGS